MFPMESEVEGDDSPLPEDCDNGGADMLQSDKERCQNNTPRGGLQMTDDKSTSIKIPISLRSLDQSQGQVDT